MEISQKYCNGFKKPSRNELEEGGSLKSKVLRALMADLIYKFAILTLFAPGGPPCRAVAYNWANTCSSVLKKT